MTDVFISYAREDSEIARKISLKLTKLGFDVWYDALIPANANWRGEINRHLEKARSVLVLWSQHAASSNFVHDEAAVALEKGKLVQARLEDIAPPIGFRSLQAAPFEAWNERVDEPCFLSTLSAIRHIHVSKATGQSPPMSASVDELNSDLRMWVACLQLDAKTARRRYLSRFPYGLFSEVAVRRGDAEEEAAARAFAEQTGGDLLRALRNNDHMALFNLGVDYQNGTGGLPLDMKAGKHAYLLASQLGSVLAQWNLALCYQKGDGTIASDEAALKWFKVAAENGEKRAYSLIADHYLYGMGVKRDVGEAYQWLQRAVAATDDPECMCQLGVYHEDGLDGTKDTKAALAWFKRAQAKGFAGGFYHEGLMERRSTSSGQQRAVGLLQRALTLGDQRAALALAEMHENGEGVLADTARAIAFYKQALDSGNDRVREFAQRAIDRLS